jgi:quinoprotein glucose dehydrogenase
MPLLAIYLLIVAVFTSAAADVVVPLVVSGQTVATPPLTPDHEWVAYGGDPGGTRFTPLDDVTAATVGRLGVAWTYRTGDVLQGGNGSRFQATPLMVDGRLILSTPFGRVIALRPDTGDELWAFDPRVDLDGDYGDFANRGVAYWRSGRADETGPCRARVFVAPIDARLIALDAATGRPCERFGSKGHVSLDRDLVNAPAYAGEYQVTSPPAVIGDVVVVGSAIADNQRADAPSGVVRAYDVRTGRLRWRWDPMDGRAGAANAWSIMSVDVERDLVFVPVGSASPDFYGGERPGDNRHANSLVALRGSSGELVWAYQVVHHDLWDYDVASQPVLVTLRRDGRDVPAVVQATKMGHVFVLHRETGAPLFPVEERAVPQSDVPGEQASPTQPFPLPAFALAPDRLDAASAWGATEADRAYCRDRLSSLRSEGMFTPPSLRGTVIYPGNVGGSHWGGVSWDPTRRRLLAPTNRLPFVVRLVPRAGLDQARVAAPGVETAAQRGTPYGMQREVLRAPSGLPCSAPPWGVLSALDLDAGTRPWEHPLGRMAPEADPAWGSVNLGGVLVTGGGLAFVAATMDGHFRAVDLERGIEQWSFRLPAGGHALPMSYRYGGRQYVVVAAGGHPRMGMPASDHVVAFALDASAPAAPSTASLPGTYEGEFRGGRRRYGVQMTVRAADAGHVATVTLRQPAATGTLQGVTEGVTVRWRGTLVVKDPGCEATLDVPLQLANGGRDLLGDGTVQGTCTEGRVEPAAFSLRRRR